MYWWIPAGTPDHFFLFSFLYYSDNSDWVVILSPGQNKIILFLSLKIPFPFWLIKLPLECAHIFLRDWLVVLGCLLVKFGFFSIKNFGHHEWARLWLVAQSWELLVQRKEESKSFVMHQTAWVSIVQCLSLEQLSTQKSLPGLASNGKMQSGFICLAQHNAEMLEAGQEWGSQSLDVITAVVNREASRAGSATFGLSLVWSQGCRESLQAAECAAMWQ